MTVNLEKELLKANKKLQTPEELLIVQEYEKSADIADDDSLRRVGVLASIEKGRTEKKRINQLKEQAARFKQERVFHISQIEEICGKYLLRFLPSCHYSGTVDKELSYKISNFEAAYGVTCECHKRPQRGTFSFYFQVNAETGMQEMVPSVDDNIVQNTFIMAPKESFNLQARPKDPLFFYKINDEYYYLIHKWGNDLSITRRLKGFFSSPLNCTLVLLALNVIGIVASVPVVTKLDLGCLIANSLCLGYNLFMYFFNEPFTPYKNKWNSEYFD